MPVPFPVVTTFKTLARIKNGGDLTPPTLRMRGMRYYYGIRTCIHIYLTVMCLVSTNGKQAGLANLKLTVEGMPPHEERQM